MFFFFTALTQSQQDFVFACDLEGCLCGVYDCVCVRGDKVCIHDFVWVSVSVCESERNCERDSVHSCAHVCVCGCVTEGKIARERLFI